jgi:uroporphyrinogen decarboxylase
MRRLGIDIHPIAPKYIGPPRQVFSDGSFTTEWGTHRQIIEHQFGTYYDYASYPLAEIETLAELEAYNWTRAEWWDVSDLAEQIAQINADADFCMLYEAGGIFELAWGLRGMERFMMDMIMQPEIPQVIMTHLTDTYIALAHKVLRAAQGRIDIAWTWDDVGAQNGPLIAPSMWAEQIKPHHVRLNRVLKEYGVTLMYHSDGSIVDFIDGFIEMGVEVLNPLQPAPKGMNLARIKNQYGARLSFHGAIDIQNTLPYGTPEQVAAEVRDRIQTLGAGGGYILAPTHQIQADTPMENILTLFDTARDTPVPPRPTVSAGEVKP